MMCISSEKFNLSLLNVFPFQHIYLIMAVCKMFIHRYVHTQAFASNKVPKVPKKTPWHHSTSETALQIHETRHRKSKSWIFKVPFDNLSGNNSPDYFSPCFKFY